MKTYEKVTHTFEPVYDENSRILILGTFPSVKSREQQFYYGHPQNRFWKLLAALTGCEGSKDDSGEKKSCSFRMALPSGMWLPAVKLSVPVTAASETWCQRI